MTNVKTISHTVGKMTHPTFRVAKGKKERKLFFGFLGPEKRTLSNLNREIRWDP